jgi:hypothetical protein
VRIANTESSFNNYSETCISFYQTNEQGELSLGIVGTSAHAGTILHSFVQSTSTKGQRRRFQQVLRCYRQSACSSYASVCESSAGILSAISESLKQICSPKGRLVCCHLVSISLFLNCKPHVKPVSLGEIKLLLCLVLTIF